MWDETSLDEHFLNISITGRGIFFFKNTGRGVVWIEKRWIRPTHLAEIGDVMGDLKVAERSSSLGMDHSLRDPLPVEVSHLVQEDDILKATNIFITEMFSNKLAPLKFYGLAQGF